jgi:hypothetical protein
MIQNLNVLVLEFSDELNDESGAAVSFFSFPFFIYGLRNAPTTL